MAQPTQLAIHGGEPTFPEGPPRWPLADPAVHDSLQRAFTAGNWGRYHGPNVEQLEAKLAKYHNTNFAFSCCSGTFAVELALRALKVDVDDEVILAGYDFSGNFRSIEAIRARPVLVDIDPQSASIDVSQVEDAISNRTRAVIASHLHGGIVPMSALRAIADRRGVLIVEDACQTPGGRVEGKMAGTWGDVGVLSFGGSKLLTAGRGGAIITQREDVHQRAKSFCEQGNHAFPLSELQAAVLLPQLELLAERNTKRSANARYLFEQLQDLNGLASINKTPSDSLASYFKMGWQVNHQNIHFTREQFLVALQAEGVAIDIGFRGFSRRGPRRCRRVGDLEHSALAAKAMMLLHHPILLAGRSTLMRVVAAFQKVYDVLNDSGAGPGR